VNPRLKAEKILQELNYDFRGFEIEQFIKRVGDLKGRRIRATPWKMPPAMFGAWLADEDDACDYIFYRIDAPPVHQIHIQLHELAHLLFGHPTFNISRIKIAESYQGKGELPLKSYGRLRSTDQSDDENEAETLASMIQEQVIRYSQFAQLTHGISSDEKLARFARDIGLI
jgi:hypothetical protein